MRHASPIQALIDELRRLPGIGERTAQRLAFHLLREPEEDVLRFARALEKAKTEISECPSCCDLTDVKPCRICSDPARDSSVLCIVEQPQDLLAIERTREFKGRYHVLHGALSPVRGVGPDELRITELLAWTENSEVKEFIAAMNPTVEGEATALYLSKVLTSKGFVVTRVAQGLPAGTSLDHVDELTMSRALLGRRPG